MKFLFDENADRRLVAYLQKLGHDIKIVGIDFPASIKDEEVLAISYTEKRLLITNDTSDFGELIFRLGKPYYAVILFRFKLQESNITLKKQQLQIVLESNLPEFPVFIIITPATIKVRK